jgi:hypothetical protein
MATTVTFSNMLNQYLPEPLLFEELKKRDWLLQNCEQDDSWLGGTLIIPFLGAVGSTVTFGSLAAASDIAEEVSVRGQISAYKEVWSSMIFNETDLMQHGKVSEQNFMRILPDALDRHASYLKGVVSQSLLTGAYVAVATADGDASGNITVAQPDRFQIGQKCQIDDDNSSPVDGYVRAINLNTGVINFFSARSGGAAVDLSGYTTAQNATIYQDGQQSNGFTALRGQLLSSANGGSSTLFGQTKTAYPFLQAINLDGGSSGLAINAGNILSKIFDAYVTIRRLGRGSPFNVVMSYKNYGSCIKALEVSKGSFNVKPMSSKAATYGWDELEVGGFAGTLKLIAVQEMDDDIVYFLDMKTIKFYTNGGIRRRKSPEGIEFYTVRNTTGYQYIVDHCLFGDMVVIEPQKNGVIKGISYTV